MQRYPTSAVQLEEVKSTFSCTMTTGVVEESCTSLNFIKKTRVDTSPPPTEGVALSSYEKSIVIYTSFELSPEAIGVPAE